MKKVFIVVCSILLFVSCKQKVLSGPDLEKKLIKTMQQYLDKEAESGVSFTVKDVTYFPDKDRKEYNCEFHVNMHTDKADTVGTMLADISNDFEKVKRKQ